MGLTIYYPATPQSADRQARASLDGSKRGLLVSSLALTEHHVDVNSPGLEGCLDGSVNHDLGSSRGVEGGRRRPPGKSGYDGPVKMRRSVLGEDPHLAFGGRAADHLDRG